MTSHHHSGSPAPRTRRTRGLAALSATALVVATLISASGAAAPAQATGSHTITETFDSTTGTRWTAPSGVTRISVEVAGSHGARTQFSTGGRGDLVTFDMTVSPGQEFTFYGSTGGNGREGGKGWRTGGKGGDKSGPSMQGAGGGGASAVLLNGQVIAVAGGGGGGGGWAKTSNKGDDTVPWIPVHGGTGGDAGKNGTAGESYRDSYKPGKGGAGAARPGKSGQNGTPSAYFSDSAGGGGGGGGWASGNGGGSGKAPTYNAGGGGGGGSSWVDARFTATMEPHSETNGYVRISYETPVTLTFIAPATATEGQQLSAQLIAYDPVTESILFGRHVVVLDNRILFDSTGWADWFAFTLPPGVHTLEYYFAERGLEVARTAKTITVTPVSTGSLGEREATHFDVDMPDRVFALGDTITVAGTLTAASGAIPGLVDVHVSVDGTAVGQTRTTTTGSFSFFLPEGTPEGSHEIKLTSAGTPLFLEATPVTIPFTVVEERAAVAIASVSTSAPVYGQPIDVVATVAPADGFGPPPTGVVVLADDEELLGLATIGSDGRASFTGVLPHPGTTAMRALYAGDDVYDSANSPDWALTIADAATTTTLTATNATGHAGDLTEILVTVSAQQGSVLEPAGHVELLVDGEVYATASVGADEDATAGDGTVAYSFDTDHLPSGTLVLQARFVPGDGYTASSSDAVTLDLVDHETRLFASPTDIAITEGDTATIAAHVEVLGHADGQLMRQASGAPEPAGVLIAYLGDEIVGTADVDPASGDAELQLDALPLGSGALRLVFVPDALGLSASEATVVYTVTAAPTPAEAPATGLPTTGVDASVGLLAGGAALALLLGGALIAMRRRTSHS